MAESKVLKAEELEKLKQFQEQERQIILELGQVEYQIQSLEKRKDQVLDAKEQFEQASAKFGEELTKIYGEGTINIQTGEIT